MHLAASVPRPELWHWRAAFSRDAIYPHGSHQTSVPEWDRQFRLVRVQHEHREKLGRLRLTVARAAASTRLLAREALSSGYPRISGSKGAILLHRRNNCYAPIGTGNGGGHTARFGLARGRSLRRRDCSLAMPARI